MAEANFFYIDPVPSADSGVGGQPSTTSPSSSVQQTSNVTTRNDGSNLASRVESLENLTSDIRENWAKKGQDANFNNLDVKDRLTANFGKIGGFDVSSGVLSTNKLIIDSNNENIRSTNYQPGVSGFKVSSELVEAENILARGALRGVSFNVDDVSVVGGQLMVANGGNLETDMSSLDASTMTLKGGNSFAVDDILLIQQASDAGVVAEWLTVTAKSGNTYTVTRDLAGSFSADANPAWSAGTPVVKQGDSSSPTYGGWLRLIGEGTNAPYYSVFQRNSATYNDYSEAVRMGNLNGIGNNSSDTYGFFAGNASTGNYLQYDTSSGNLVINDSALNFNAFYGDGVDGDVTISSNTTLTADKYYNNLTINNGFTLNTGGYRVFVKGTLINNGSIGRDGNPGGNGGNAGAGPVPGSAGAAASTLSTGTLYGGLGGKQGALGQAALAAGNTGASGGNQTESYAANGVSGGYGGGLSNGTGRAAAGTGGTITQTIQPIRNSTFAVLMREFSSDNTVKYIKTSAESGGGASGQNFSSSNSSGGGGGSGGSGGIVLICARKIANSGTISAKGGNGGNAGAGYAPSSSVSGSGGGAGGSGGILVIIYNSLSNSGTISVAGGTGGTKAVKIGAAGEDGQNGTDGNAGTLIQLQV